MRRPEEKQCSYKAKMFQFFYNCKFCIKCHIIDKTPNDNIKIVDELLTFMSTS